MYDKLGLKQEDEKETKAREDACDTRGSSTVQTDFYERCFSICMNLLTAM
jgi:hypothetical protein